MSPHNFGVDDHLTPLPIEILKVGEQTFRGEYLDVRNSGQNPRDIGVLYWDDGDVGRRLYHREERASRDDIGATCGVNE